MIVRRLREYPVLKDVVNAYSKCSLVRGFAFTDSIVEKYVPAESKNKSCYSIPLKDRKKFMEEINSLIDGD